MNKTNLFDRLCQIGFVLSLLFVSKGAFAAPTATLDDIAFAALPGGRFEVQMKFDAPPTEPTGYEIEKPARIVLDFAGVKNGLSGKRFPLPFENAQSAVVLGGEDRTRVIINMTALDVYTTNVDGNKFIVQVGGNKVADVHTRNLTLQDKVSSEITTYDSAITGIDFRRGEGGEGKILIDLSRPTVSVNVEQTAREIQLNFLDTKLPVELRRKLDVVDFATPVLSVSSSFDGRDSKIAIVPQGEYDYLAYQADNLYVISVKELTDADKAEKKEKFAFVGEKLSLNFQDIPVRSVLQIIADFTELNLVASDTVKGQITLRLDNVPWDQALALVLKTKGLDKRQVGNVLMVAPAEEIAEQERQQLEAQRQLEELAPLRTEYITVLYADANELFKLFRKSGGGGGGGKKGAGSTQGILSERGSAIVDERTNSIVLTETAAKIEQFRSLIKKLDVPVRQVSIEARIVKANTNYEKAQGVNWFFSKGTDYSGGDYSLGQWGQSVLSTAADSVWSVSILDTRDGDSLNLILGALQTTGNGEVVSQPKVVTQDKKQAFIKDGTLVPYQTTDEDGVVTIEFEEAVTELEVTPYITPNDRILMKVNVNKDAVGAVIQLGGDGGAIPIETTELDTEIMVDNGQTAVIGGLFEEGNTTSRAKVPVLGDIPFIGKLFSSTTVKKEKTELLIFLTPRIMSDPLARD